MPHVWKRPAEPIDPRTRATGLAPAQVEALTAAARAIRDGRAELATRGLRTMLGTAPDHPEALRLLGIAQWRTGNLAAARDALQRALAQWPHDPLTLTDLGNIEHAAGDAAAAEAAWREAVAHTPTAAVAWWNLGRLYQLQGRTDEAIDALTRTCALSASHWPARILLGDAQVHAGHFDAAEHAYREALALNGTCGDAWRGLANIKTRPLPEADRQHLIALLQSTALAAADRIAMGFALGKASEDHGHHAEAVAALQAAHACQARLAPWDAAAFHAHVAATRAASAALPPPVDPTLGHEIIFIVGMPRSGSTLVEQILAAHPQVEGASELPDLGHVLAAESARRGMPCPRWFPAASAADWLRLGRDYLDRTRRWRTHKPRSTDKLPENWLHVGILAAMLPGAHIIDTQRNALETAWSCFKQQFYQLPHFATGYDELAAYLSDHETALRPWHAATPARIRRQSHEALLANPEDEIRALLAFCALPFNPACLDFRHAKRSVRTASAAQVREPLQRNTARTGAYGALLDPLRAALARHGM